MNQEQSTIPLNEHLNNIYKTILAETGAVAVFFSSYEPTEHIMKVLADAEVRFKVLLGKYDGSYETCYTVASEHLGWLFSSGLVDGQETVLLASADGTGFLMHNKLDENGAVKVDNLGLIEAIDRADALQRQAFTFDPEDGLYYGTTHKAA